MSRNEQILAPGADNVLTDDPAIAPDDSPVDSEEARCKALWAAVLAVAFRDATMDTRFCTCATETSETDALEARRVLTSDLDPWRQDRDAICDAIGVDPDRLRDRARKILAPVIAAELAGDGPRVRVREFSFLQLGFVPGKMQDPARREERSATGRRSAATRWAKGAAVTPQPAPAIAAE